MKTLIGMLQIETGAKMIWSCKKVFTEFIDSRKCNNPLLRMYFDSDLGSPIEQTLEQTYAYASYETIKHCLPENSCCNNFAEILGNTLARLSIKVLDVTKLNYKYFNGHINFAKYNYELTKRTLCTIATVIDNGWFFIKQPMNKGICGVLVFLQIDKESAQYFADITCNFISMAKHLITKQLRSEEVINFVSKGVQKIATGIIHLKDKAQATIKKISQILDTTYDKIVDFAANTVNRIHTATNQVVNWVRNLI